MMRPRAKYLLALAILFGYVIFMAASLPLYAQFSIEQKYSEKAIQVMALLGDPWAKLKIKEIQAKKELEKFKAYYESISWFDFFRKIDAYGMYHTARKNYREAEKELKKFEMENGGGSIFKPNNGKDIFDGLDKLNESILEVKALFGDKKAKAQLEYIRAKKEFERIDYEYRNTSWFDFGKKWELRKLRSYAQTRLEIAQKELERVTGAPPATRTPTAAPPATAVPETPSSPSSRTSVSTVPSDSGTKQGPANEQALRFVRESMNAAYKRYVDYLSSPNPDPTKLELLKQEYLMAAEEYKKLTGGR